MVFASSVFLYYFLPLFLALYYLSPARLRSYTIALASYVFYGWWRPDFVLLMLFSTVVDFHCGRAIVRARSGAAAPPRAGRRWVGLSLCVNLGLLAYFKYANFGIETLNALLGELGHDAVPWTKVVLPVGISFYTFQTISYTVDVYRGDSPPVRAFRDFLCYVSMFPQLVAGPIVRYGSVATQLHSREHTLGAFYRGVLSFQVGLAKKLLIADVLGQVADAAFAAPPGSLGTADAWLGTVAYAFQIYFDFSGYSDMAIGLGLMMGFRFPVNFDGPYRSRSITEFWRRWHISLSSFLRDYLYIPLGGNRRGALRTYVNLGLTMLLGGLWHGANWTFIAWGAYQGFWLMFERRMGKRPLYARVPAALQMAFTFVLVLFGWVLFRADTLGAALEHGATMLGLGTSATESLIVRPIHVLAFAVAGGVVWITPTTQRLLRRPPVPWTLLVQALFLLALLQLHRVSHVPFLYFQF